MDGDKSKLKGSPSRDEFKYWHKNALPQSYYGCDLDYLCVTKSPLPGIIAAFDYKESNDSISFTEVIAYNDLNAKGIAVYIVQSTARSDFASFNVSLFIKGNHLPNPPTYETQVLLKDATQEQFIEWEGKLRQTWMSERKPAITVLPKEQMTDVQGVAWLLSLRLDRLPGVLRWLAGRFDELLKAKDKTA